MADIVLYHTPGACSRVTISALEEIGVEFEDRAVDIFNGEQKTPQYLAVNPKGKVPALHVDGRLHTENAAILYFLHQRYPAARLLPTAGHGVDANEALEDLFWCSSSVHPMVRQIRMPIRFTNGDPSGVKAHGMQNFPAVLETISNRVSGDRWWYGETWSVLDVYLYWNYSTAASGGMDLTPWPALARHAERVRQRPSFVRGLARERAALERHGLALPPGASL
jgi:glutathione S-transferase